MASRTSVPSRKPKAMPQRRASVRVGLEVDGARTAPAVLTFLRDLEHPLKHEVEAVRQLVLEVDPSVREDLKWNAPSFYTADHFATFNLRANDRVRLILHTGAKAKGLDMTGVKAADPAGVLEWLAKDRCVVSFRSAADVQERRELLQSVLRAWLRRL